jgi:hypothetical protein
VALAVIRCPQRVTHLPWWGVPLIFAGQPHHSLTQGFHLVRLTQLTCQAPHCQMLVGPPLNSGGPLTRGELQTVRHVPPTCLIFKELKTKLPMPCHQGARNPANISGSAPEFCGEPRHFLARMSAPFALPSRHVGRQTLGNPLQRPALASHEMGAPKRIGKPKQLPPSEPTICEKRGDHDKVVGKTTPRQTKGARADAH